MSERMIRVNGVELATEAFGDAAQPPVLLIMGGMASMLWWRDAFCERLAGGGRFVVRYDSRDTGHSSKYPPGKPGYRFEDMADDVFRILDGYDLPAAHIVGMSFGGMVGQAAALKRPARVRSLTAISSSPLGEDTSRLPGFSEAVAEHMNTEVDWSKRDQAIAYMVAESRLLAGTARAFDAAEVSALVARDFDRSGGYSHATNHAFLGPGKEWQGRLREMIAPLCVIHGTADPIYPIAHGEVLAGAVAGATLLPLEGGGHELNPAHWDRIIDAILSQTRR
jgi:pimeloyl-ACP methyl ester carboxylesterase